MMLNVFIFEDFHCQNVLTMFLFFIKHFYLFMTKITSDVNNSSYLGILGIWNISVLLKLYTPMKHLIKFSKEIQVILNFYL